MSTMYKLWNASKNDSTIRLRLREYSWSIYINLIFTEAFTFKNDLSSRFADISMCSSCKWDPISASKCCNTPISMLNFMKVLKTYFKDFPWYFQVLYPPYLLPLLLKNDLASSLAGISMWSSCKWDPISISKRRSTPLHKLHFYEGPQKIL